MVFPEQEVPLILIVFLGAVGSAFILFYRNFLCPKEPTALVQKIFITASLLSVFLSITSVLRPNRTLFLFDWILSGLLLAYTVFSFFLPSAYSRSMVTWSDFFLVGLSVVFFAMRMYTSLLLTYDRSRQKNLPKSLIRPILKPADLHTVSYPNSMQINNNIPETI